MSQSVSSPALPRGLASSARVYVRPVALADGARAAALLAARRALSLAGGPLAFAACEVVIREPDGAVRRLHADVRGFGEWTAGLEAPARRRLDELVARLTAPRPALCGLPLGRPLVMGIVNVTPDSFSDGGRHAAPEAAVRHGEALAEAGADIVDVGGESTRPGAEPVAEAEELARVLPVVEGLAGLAAPLSIDTRRAAVMARAVAAGATMINDVSALAFDPRSPATAAAAGVPVVLMHSRGEPRTMNRSPAYGDTLLEVYDELEARVEAALAAGIPRRHLVVDPGIGFAKSARHNLEVLRGASLFHGLGCALALGASRKLGPSRGSAPAERLPASLAAALWGASQGVHILRVHDVAETRRALALWAELGLQGGAALPGD